jgi:hypothetical protein
MALSSTVLGDFVGGNYLVWDISGRVQVSVTNLVPAGNAVISGLFFDPPGARFAPAVQVENGVLHFQLHGESGRAYLIESSDDLVNWTPVSTVQNVGGTADISQQIPQGTAQGFYRAVRLP